jgi:hypothetical protein
MKIQAFPNFNLLSIFFVVTMLDQSWRCSIVRKEICRSRSIVGGIGAKDIAAVNERGGRLNLCLEQDSVHFLKIINIFYRKASLSASSRLALIAMSRGSWNLAVVGTHFNFFDAVAGSLTISQLHGLIEL